MIVNVGDKVVKADGFGNFYVLTVTGRTNSAIATRFQNGSTCDHRALLRHFKFLDGAKVAKLLSLVGEIEQKQIEARRLYESLEKVE